MNIMDYKKSFINLLKEMEEDLGECTDVDIEHWDGSYKCTIRF